VFKLYPRWLRVLAASLASLSVSTTAMAAQPADLIAKAPATSQAVVDHNAWTELLQTYVKPGSDGLNRVDYGAFKANGHAALKSYIQRLQSTDLSSLARNDQFAFLANLYNAKTIDVVLDAYPVKSIKDISLGGGLIASVTGGPWKAKVMSLGGQKLSLDDIEHQMLRPVFKDPRVHYAVNCASIGCPNLQQQAFTGAALNEQLETAARAFVNHPRAVSIKNGELMVSSIYRWFAADFGGSDKRVVVHLQRFADAALKSKLDKIEEIADDMYDWQLNDIAK
jgi:hypothetical protein